MKLNIFNFFTTRNDSVAKLCHLEKWEDAKSKLANMSKLNMEEELSKKEVAKLLQLIEFN